MGRGNRRQMLKEEVIGASTMPVFWGVEVFLMARQHIIRWRFGNSLGKRTLPCYYKLSFRYVAILQSGLL